MAMLLVLGGLAYVEEHCNNLSDIYITMFLLK